MAGLFKRENNRTKWGMFLQSMLDYQTVFVHKKGDGHPPVGRVYISNIIFGSGSMYDGRMTTPLLYPCNLILAHVNCDVTNKTWWIK